MGKKTNALKKQTGIFLIYKLLTESFAYTSVLDDAEMIKTIYHDKTT